MREVRGAMFVAPVRTAPADRRATTASAPRARRASRPWASSRSWCAPTTSRRARCRLDPRPPDCATGRCPRTPTPPPAPHAGRPCRGRPDGGLPGRDRLTSRRWSGEVGSRSDRPYRPDGEAAVASEGASRGASRDGGRLVGRVRRIGRRSRASSRARAGAAETTEAATPHRRGPGRRPPGPQHGPVFLSAPRVRFLSHRPRPGKVAGCTKTGRTWTGRTRTGRTWTERRGRT